MGRWNCSLLLFVGLVVDPFFSGRCLSFVLKCTETHSPAGLCLNPIGKLTVTVLPWLCSCIWGGKGRCGTRRGREGIRGIKERPKWQNHVPKLWTPVSPVALVFRIFITPALTICIVFSDLPFILVQCILGSVSDVGESLYCKVAVDHQTVPGSHQSSVRELQKYMWLLCRNYSSWLGHPAVVVKGFIFFCSVIFFFFYL